MKVSDLMRGDVVTVSPGQSLAKAQALMHNHRLRHLPVVEHGDLVGVVTERDLIRALGELQAAPEQIPVSQVMVEDVVTVTADTPAADAIHKLNRGKLGCLPVVLGQRVVGILTVTELLNYAEQAADDQQRREQAAEYEADA